jgi:LemA protein
MIFLIAVALLGFAGLVLGGWGVSVYNSLVALKNAVELAWSNIEVLLKQRHDELGKLIEVVKGNKEFEQQTLQRVVEARAAYSGAGNRVQAMAAAAAETVALRGLFAVAEAYPELKANLAFQQLQARISELESQIADRREGYNDSVNLFNTRIEQFPDNMVAGLMNYRRREYFRVEPSDTQDVEIKL